MSDITIRINETLKEMDISKGEFYEKCKITSSAYSQWNTEKTVPKASSLKRISDFLNVNYQWLQFGTGEKRKSPPPKKDGELLAEAIELIRLFDIASPELRSAALAVLKSAEVAGKGLGTEAKEK